MIVGKSAALISEGANMNRRNFLFFLASAPVAAVMIGKGIIPASPTFGEMALRATTGPVGSLAMSPLLTVNNWTKGTVDVVRRPDGERLILDVIKKGITRGDLDHPSRRR